MFFLRNFPFAIGGFAVALVAASFAGRPPAEAVLAAFVLAGIAGAYAGEFRR